MILFGSFLPGLGCLAPPLAESLISNPYVLGTVVWLVYPGTDGSVLCASADLGCEKNDALIGALAMTFSS